MREKVSGSGRIKAKRGFVSFLAKSDIQSILNLDELAGILLMSQLALEPHFEGAQLVFNTDGNPEFVDARELISRLLVLVAKGDGSISSLELGQMIDALSSCCDIGSAEVVEQLSTAMMAAADSDNVVYLREIARSLSPTEKLEIFSMAIDVAMADDHMDPGELRALDLVGQILGLPQDTIHSQLRRVNS